MTKEESNEIRVPLTEYTKQVAAEAARAIMKEYADSAAIQLVHEIKVHSDTCQAKVTLDRIKWLLIGSFGSGLVGGGTIGAWIVTAIKNGVVSMWFLQIKEFFA